MGNLKEVSVRIFGSSGDEASKIALEAAEEEHVDPIEIEEKETWLTKGKNKPPNLPNSNDASVKGAMRSMNMDNGFQTNFSGKGRKQQQKGGELWRIRCGQSGHTWQSCPLPYQPQLAFGKSNGAPSSGKGKKKVLLTDEITYQLHDSDKTDALDTKNTDDTVVQCPQTYNDGEEEWPIPETNADYGHTWFSSGENAGWYCDENVWMCQSWEASSKFPIIK